MKKTQRREMAVRWLLVVALLFVAGALPAAGGDLAERIEALVADELEKPGAVGLSVAVAIGDEMVLEKGFGLAEVEHQVAADAETVFRVGSITKQFTAAAIMRLVEAGKVEVDAPLRRYLPDFPTHGHEVTVRHLLTHTSGIKSYTGLGEEWRRTVPLELSHDELLAMVQDHPYDFEPDEKYLYNNSGFYLLGVIIEKVSGKPYAEYLRDELAEPLGLPRIRHGTNADIIPNRAQGYRMVDGELHNDELIGMSQPYAAGAIIASAGDLVRWQLAFTRERVVSAESYSQMTTPHELRDGESTGYGFGLAAGDFEGHRRIQHGGGINGFNSMLAWYPDEGVSIATISNSQAYSANRLATAIARLALDLPPGRSDE